MRSPKQLAASAKRAKSIASDKNVVDWLLTSETWYGDVRQVRRENAVKNIGGETMVLSSKRTPSQRHFAESRSSKCSTMPRSDRAIHGGLVSRGQLKNHDGRHRPRKMFFGLHREFVTEWYSQHA